MAAEVVLHQVAQASSRLSSTCLNASSMSGILTATDLIRDPDVFLKQLKKDFSKRALIFLFLPTKFTLRDALEKFLLYYLGIFPKWGAPPPHPHPPF